MTDIEQKALALVNDCGGKHTYLKREWNPRYEALCRAIEQHEAFRQEVSDAVEMALKNYPPTFLREHLHQFIIPKPKRDPMTEVWRELFANEYNLYEFIAAMDARGLEIREKNDD